MRTIALSLGGALVVLWLFFLVSIVSGVWRAGRRAEQRQSASAGRYVALTPWLLLVGASFLMVINVIAVLVGSVWYHLKKAVGRG